MPLGPPHKPPPTPPPLLLRGGAGHSAGRASGTSVATDGEVSQPRCCTTVRVMRLRRPHDDASSGGAAGKGEGE